MNFRPINLNFNNDILSPATSKQAQALLERIDALEVKRGALQGKERQYSQAPLTEIVDWSTLDKTYAELLVEELTLRQDIAKWERLHRQDAANYQDKISNSLITTQEKVRKDLHKIGFTEESMSIRRPLADGGCMVIGSDEWVRAHPDVRKLTATGYEPTANDDTQLAECEKEIKALRQKKLA